MSFREILNLVWINLLENKFKVLLTSLGIIVGSATIVIVIAIGQGGQQDVQEQFKNLNAGTVTISDNSSASSGGGMFGGMMAAACRPVVAAEAAARWRAASPAGCLG